MSELRHTIASVFLKSGKKVMDREKFQMSLAMDMKWFSPKEALQVLEIALSSGELLETDSGLKPSFNMDEVDVPLDFKPSEKLLTLHFSGKADLFSDIVTYIIKNTELDKKSVIAASNRIQNEFDVHVEVAALLLARKLELDIEDFIKRVEEHLIEEFNIKGSILQKEG